MNPEKFKYIYGPVPSWRLGHSLGIDPVSKGHKICSFDCVYCQIGKTGLLTDRRQEFISDEEIVAELNALPEVKIDYITFSGAGEPTLAANLGRMIRSIRQTRPEKVAVITNASLIDRQDVQDDLMQADFVLAKFDASDQDGLIEINQPVDPVRFENIFPGIKSFRKRYRGRLALQIMFIEQNRDRAQDLARLAREIQPDEVQINTPLRPCAVKPLPEAELKRVQDCFAGLKTLNVYDAEKTPIQPISTEDTLVRRGKV